jgi:hypothetical protein
MQFRTLKLTVINSDTKTDSALTKRRDSFSGLPVATRQSGQGERKVLSRETSFAPR